MDLLEALDTFLEAVSVVAKWQQLDPLVARTEKKIGAIFKRQGQILLRGFASLRGQIGEARLREALGADDWIRVFDTATGATLEAFFETVQGAAREGLRRGAAQTLADVNIDIAFDLRNPRAEQYLQQHGYGLITQINAVTRGNIATIIDNGMREGWSYGKMAREINSLYSEMAVGKPQQHIDSRGHLIAITEIGQAYEAGGAIVIQDLQNAGLQMEKEWLTVGDDRVSDGCQANMSEGWIPYAQAFSSGHMHPLRFPGCRCTVLYRRKPTRAATPPAARPPRTTRPGDGEDMGPVVVDAPGPIPSFRVPAPPQPAQQQLQYQPADRQLRVVNDHIADNVKRAARRNRLTEEEVEETIEAALNTLISDKPIAIQFKSRNLDALLVDGRFKSQFETSSSGGLLDLDYRASAEYSGIGMPLRLPATERPIYGYVNLGKMAQQMVGNYGDLAFVMKNTVRERTTMTVGDSLYPFSQGQLAATPLTAPGKASWDNNVSALLEYAQTGNISDLLMATAYLEVQIQGGVTLDDVEAVIDSKGALTAAQRKALEDRGIQIWKR